MELFNKNYGNIVTKAQSILLAWGNRNLSLFGKILLINTLMASLFVYKMSVLPSIPSIFTKKLDQLCESFLWNGKKAKISLKTLQRNKQDGGVGLVNFQLKDDALKASWVKIIHTDSYIMEFANRKLSPILRETIWKVNLQLRDIDNLFDDSFWKDVLKAWSKINYVEDVPDENIPQQILWYNSHIKIEGKTVLYPKAFQEGLSYVSQLLDSQGGFLPPEITRTMFSLYIMQYNSLISAFPREWKKVCVNIKDMTENYDKFYDNFQKKEKVVSYYYTTVNTCNSVC